MVSSPCKNCTKRRLACHDECREYLIFKDKKQEIKERKTEYLKKHGGYVYDYKWRR